MTNPTSERARLEQIRERAATYVTGTLHAEVYHEDVTLLLSLLDSEAASGNTDYKRLARVREMKYRYKDGYGIVSNSAGACDEIITALQSLTLEQEQKTK